MIDLASYFLLSLVSLCFGILVGFQIAHISHVKKLAKLAKRCVDTGTLAPVLVELETAGMFRESDLSSSPLPGK
jgi:hypothetical protein